MHGLVAVVLGGNLASFIFNRQVWPYSPYPMFADAREDPFTFETLALVGEPVDTGSAGRFVQTSRTSLMSVW